MQDRPGTVLALQEGKDRPLRVIFPEHFHHAAETLLAECRNPTLRHLHLLLGKLPITNGVSLHRNHRKVRKEAPLLPLRVTHGLPAKPPHQVMERKRHLNAHSGGVLLPAHLQREAMTFFIIVMIIFIFGILRLCSMENIRLSSSNCRSSHRRR